MGIFVVTAQCSTHGLSVLIENEDSQIAIVGAECACAKVSYWKYMRAEMMGELEEMLDKQRVTA